MLSPDLSIISLAPWTFRNVTAAEVGECKCEKLRLAALNVVTNSRLILVA